MKNIKQYKESFINQYHDFSHINFYDVISHVEDYGDRPTHSAASDVLRFYLDEDIFSDLQKRFSDRMTLPENLQELLKENTEFQNALFHRMFIYILSIVINEARHSIDESDFDAEYFSEDSIDEDDEDDIFGLWSYFEDKTEKAIAFSKYLVKAKNIGTNYVYGINSDQVVILHRLINDEIQENVSLEEFLLQMKSLYVDFSWFGDYGGDSWASLTQLLIDVSSGVITPKIFIDSAFSQEHNTGGIFDKNIIYKNSEENSSLLPILLEAQRMGAIPKLLLSDFYFDGEVDNCKQIVRLKEKYPEYLRHELTNCESNLLLHLEVV